MPNKQKKYREFSLRTRGGQRKYLNTSERKLFYSAVLSIENSEQRLFLLMLYYTGARVSEILAIEWSDIDLWEREVVIRTLKRRSEETRYIPLPDGYLTELKVTFSSRDGRLWCFCRSTAWRMVKRVLMNAEISSLSFSPKSLRHSFAIHAIKSGVPVTELQEIMGHASVKTTMIYVKFALNERREFLKKMW